jgi:hypothetical protein
MPSTIKIRIKAARNLPVMDRGAPTHMSMGGGGASTGGVGPSRGNVAPTTSLSGSSGVATTTGMFSTDSYVTASLGGHSKLVADNADDDDDNDQHDNNPTSNSYFRDPLSHFAGGNSGGTTTNPSSGDHKIYGAKTRVIRRALHPVWNEEFRFDVANDTLLQDEPLIFKVWGSDSSASSTGGGSSSTNSSDGSIGLVYIDLNPLLAQTANEAQQNDGAGENDTKDNSKENSSSSHRRGNSRRSTSNQSSSSDTRTNSGGGGGSGGGNNNKSSSKQQVANIDGWFPIYDTLFGVRGELGLSIKLTFIGDVNPFRDSAAGVQLFPFSTLDQHSSYIVTHVFGFVEELVVADDAEFEWKDNFRQARLSNETRQSLLYLLDSSVRRRMSKKVLEMGGNAVLGYCQTFDVEGDSGLVARSYGTCVLITRLQLQMDRLLLTSANMNSTNSMGDSGPGMTLSGSSRRSMTTMNVPSSSPLGDIESQDGSYSGSARGLWPASSSSRRGYSIESEDSINNNIHNAGFGTTNTTTNSAGTVNNNESQATTPTSKRRIIRRKTSSASSPRDNTSTRSMSFDQTSVDTMGDESNISMSRSDASSPLSLAKQSSVGRQITHTQSSGATASRSPFPRRSNNNKQVVSLSAAKALQLQRQRVMMDAVAQAARHYDRLASAAHTGTGGGVSNKANDNNDYYDDVQLLTLKEFPPNVRVRIGGLVTARSVKYLGKLASKLSDQETRDGWWSELRDEVRTHAKTLCCSHVIGYEEFSTIHDDVCVLSITGTAATVRGLPDLHQAKRFLQQYEYDLEHHNHNHSGGNSSDNAASPNSKKRLSRGRSSASSGNSRRTGSWQSNSQAARDRDHDHHDMSPTSSFADATSTNNEEEDERSEDEDDDSFTDGGERGKSSKAALGLGEGHHQHHHHEHRVEPSSRTMRRQKKEARRQRLTAKLLKRNARGRSSAVTGGSEHENESSAFATNAAAAAATFLDPSSAIHGIFSTSVRARLARPCSYCHVPYHHRMAPFSNMKLVPCVQCGKKWVPEVILSTMEPPAVSQVADRCYGSTCCVQKC